jgi:hypothetical protein
MHRGARRSPGQHHTRPSDVRSRPERGLSPNDGDGSVLPLFGSRLCVAFIDAQGATQAETARFSNRGWICGQSYMSTGLRVFM